MKGLFFITILFSLLVSASFSWAEIDLDKEVLIIPDTHDVNPYVWNVTREPRGYKVSLTKDDQGQFSIELKKESSTNIGNPHVFITDEDLHNFVHLQPVSKGEGRYSFNFKAPKTGKYRFEIVFKTDSKWADIRKELTLNSEEGQKEPPVKPGDEDYGVKIKLYPKKLYAEHVSTFLYEISYKGNPLVGLEKMDGADMQLAT